MSRRLTIPAALIVLLTASFGMAATVAADTPDAVNDAVVVQKNALGAALDVLANDTLVPVGTIVEVSTPGHGSAAIAAGGTSLTYTPTTGYTGADTFTYTVDNGDPPMDTATVTVRVNAPPVAVDDPAVPGCNPTPAAFGGSFPIPEDYRNSQTDDVFILVGNCAPRGNDTDADGTVVDWEIVTPTAHGDLVHLDSNFLAYTPDPNFGTAEGDWVSDSFTYRAIDNDGARSAPATYRFWIAEVNDAPTFTAGPAQIFGSEDTPFSGSWATAVSPGPANESSQQVHFVVTPTSGANPGLFSAGPAISPTGTLTYTPAPNQVGFVILSVVAKDDGGLQDWGLAPGTMVPPDDTSNAVTLRIDIGAVNDPPAAGDDTLTVAEDAAATAVNVLADDTDADGDTLTITGKTNGTKGTVAITGGGTGVTYDPQPNAFGPDSFTYTVSDGNGGSDTATVAVTITAQQDAPSAVNDEADVAEDGGPTPINVLGNDTDADGDDLVVTSKTNGAKGIVAINASGDGVTYDPATNQTGADSFTYTISDGHGGTDTATVAVTIGPASDPPLALDDAFTVAEDAPAILVDVLANDTDPDLDELTITARTNGSKGTIVIAPDGGSLTYKPNANANGSDTFTYTVNDGTGSTATASVSVTITAVNDPPNAANDGVPTPVNVVLGGGAKAIPVLANDTSSPDGPETLTIIARTNGSHGTVAITGGGTGLTYTPTGSTTGIDVFTYTIDDGHGGTDTAQVQVQVTAAVDTTPPKAAIVTIQKSAIPGRSGLRIYVKWSLTETGSGLASQLLQRRTGTGSWVSVALSAGARAYNFALPKGHVYTFRVRATDKAGNIGAFASRQIRI